MAGLCISIRIYCYFVPETFFSEEIAFHREKIIAQKKRSLSQITFPVARAEPAVKSAAPGPCRIFFFSGVHLSRVFFLLCFLHLFFIKYIFPGSFVRKSCHAEWRDGSPCNLTDSLEVKCDQKFMFSFFFFVCSFWQQIKSNLIVHSCLCGLYKLGGTETA